MHKPLAAGVRAVRRPRLQNCHGCAAHVVRMTAVDSPGGTSCREAAKFSVRKLNRGEGGVGDIGRGAASDQWHPDANTEGSNEIGTLLLTFGRDSLLATFRERTAAKHAVGVNLFRPRIRIPRKVINTDEPVFGRDLG